MSRDSKKSTPVTPTSESAAQPPSPPSPPPSPPPPSPPLPPPSVAQQAPPGVSPPSILTVTLAALTIVRHVRGYLARKAAKRHTGRLSRLSRQTSSLSQGVANSTRGFVARKQEQLASAAKDLRDAAAASEGQLASAARDLRAAAVSAADGNTSIGAADFLSEKSRAQSTWTPTFNSDFEHQEQSLDRLRALSLSRTLFIERPLNKKRLAKLLFGWGFNWTVFWCLTMLFISYGCSFSGEGTTKDEQEALLQGWLIAVALRFALFEPAMILMGVFMPMLFASEVMGNLCGETVMNFMEHTSHIIIAFISSLKG